MYDDPALKSRLYRTYANMMGCGPLDTYIELAFAQGRFGRAALLVASRLHVVERVSTGDA